MSLKPPQQELGLHEQTGREQQPCGNMGRIANRAAHAWCDNARRHRADTQIVQSGGEQLDPCVVDHATDTRRGPACVAGGRPIASRSSPSHSAMTLRVGSISSAR